MIVAGELIVATVDWFILMKMEYGISSSIFFFQFFNLNTLNRKHQKCVGDLVGL